MTLCHSFSDITRYFFLAFASNSVIHHCWTEHCARDHIHPNEMIVWYWFATLLRSERFRSRVGLSALCERERERAAFRKSDRKREGESAPYVWQSKRTMNTRCTVWSIDRNEGASERLPSSMTEGDSIYFSLALNWADCEPFRQRDVRILSLFGLCSSDFHRLCRWAICNNDIDYNNFGFLLISKLLMFLRVEIVVVVGNTELYYIKVHLTQNQIHPLLPHHSPRF